MLGSLATMRASQRGSAFAAGTVFELTPPASPAGTWNETVLHTFTGGSDGLASRQHGRNRREEVGWPNYRGD
jgi:hypothetical protein